MFRTRQSHRICSKENKPGTITRMRFVLYHITRLYQPLLKFHSFVELRHLLSTVGISIPEIANDAAVGQWTMPTKMYYIKIIDDEEYLNIGQHYTQIHPILESMKNDVEPPWESLPNIYTTQECRNCFTLYENPSIYTVCRNCRELCRSFGTTPYYVGGNRHPLKSHQRVYKRGRKPRNRWRNRKYQQ